MVGIIYSDYYLPENYIEIKNLIQNYAPNYIRNNKEMLKVYFQSGIESVCIWKEKNLAEKTLEIIDKLLLNTNIDKTKVKYIIASNPLENTQFPINMPYLVKEKFCFDNSVVMEITQKCASVIFSMGLMSDVLKLYKGEYVIILSIYCLSKKVRYYDFTIGGDGISVVLLGDQDGYCDIIGNHTSVIGCESIRRFYKQDKKMSGLQISKYAARFVNNFLLEKKINLYDIDLFIPQNVNIVQTEILAKLMGIPMIKVFTENISRGGHIGDVDTVRNLKDSNKLIWNRKYRILFSEGINQSGDIIVSCVILQKLKH